MAICCLMIEALESFRQGWDTDRKGALPFCCFFSPNDNFASFRTIAAKRTARRDSGKIVERIDNALRNLWREVHWSKAYSCRSPASIPLLRLSFGR
jgi:hypothetical protein